MLALILIFMSLGLIAFGLVIFVNIRHVRNHPSQKNEINKFWLTNIGLIIAMVVSFMVMFILVVNHHIPGGILEYEWTLAIVGTLFAFGGLGIGVSGFILKYYQKKGDNKLAVRIRIAYYVSIFAFICGFLMLLNAFDGYLSYPLVNGIMFNSKFWSRPHSGDSPSIAFYAICILLGVALCYVVSDHKMYVQYGEHGTLDTTLIAGVVPGIIGARLWWCIAEGQMANFFDFRGGGLAVQGGVLLGALCGILWFIWRKPKYNIFVVVDIVIPTILLAQAVGRWGNFFNQEVYGMAVSGDATIWQFVPTWIKENMFINGAYRLPFFLIESALNILGYFMIAFVFKNILKRWWKPADGALGYLVWYGITRIIMEPLRDPQFIMGQSDVQISVVMSALFIAGGVLGIVVNHVLRHILGKRKRERLAKMKYKSVIFDFDGTLANSDNMLFNSFRILYAKYKPGVELTFEHAQTFSGPPIKETLSKEFPEQDIDLLMQEYRRVSAARSVDVYLYPNVKENIKKLSSLGIRIAVFTNKERDGIIKQLKTLKIERYFEMIVGGQDVENPKPAPDGINLIIEKLGLERTKTLFVGDSRYDYLASKDANVDCAIVSWSPRLDETWETNYVLADFNEMEMIVSGKERE